MITPGTISLTRNQLAILKRLADGDLCKEVARETGRSTRTIENTLLRMRKLTGARSIPHLVHIAHQQGIL